MLLPDRHMDNGLLCSRAAREFINFIIYFIVCVTFHPLPADSEMRQKDMKLLSKIFVCNGLFISKLSSFMNPCWQPLYSLLHIFTIEINNNIVCRSIFLLKVFQCFYDGKKLHSIVCRHGFSSGNSFLLALCYDDRSSSTLSWIAKTASVCVYFYLHDYTVSL